MSVCGDRRTVRRVVAHGIDGHRGVGGCSPAVADRVGEVDAAREPGRWHDLDRFLVGRDVDRHTVGHAGEGGDHQRIAVGVLVVGDEVDDDRLIGTRPGDVVAGHGRFVDAVLVDLRVADLADVGVLLGVALVLVARVVVRLVTLRAERVAPVVDAFELGVGTGDPEGAAGEVVDPDPAVHEAEPEGRRIGAGQRFGLVDHSVAHPDERRRGGGDVEHAPLMDDRGDRIRTTEFGERTQVRRLAVATRAIFVRAHDVVAEHGAVGGDHDERAARGRRLGERGDRDRCRADRLDRECVRALGEAGDGAVVAERDHVVADRAQRGDGSGGVADRRPGPRVTRQRIAAPDPAAVDVEHDGGVVDGRGDQAAPLRLEVR